MFRPGNNPYNNCIADSSYYYITPYGQIKSMDILQCPEEAKYLIKDSSSCIYNCEADSINGYIMEIVSINAQVELKK